MKKIIIFLLPLMFTSCDHIGSTRVKNLIDLTAPIEVEVTENINLTNAKKNPNLDKVTNAYKISNNNIIGQPVVAKKIMYSIDKNGFVNAFSLAEKKILWSTNILLNTKNHESNAGGILYSDAKLYVTNGTRHVVIIDAISGKEILRKETPDIIRTKPIMANDTILLLQTISNQLIGYNIEKAKFIWMYEGAIESTAIRRDIYPILHNNHALVSDSSGEMIYINVETGKITWTFDLNQLNKTEVLGSDNVTVTTLPIVNDNFVYFATSNANVIKFDLNNGMPVWQANVEDVISMSLYGKNLFVTSNARQAAAISTDDGKVKWVGSLISAKERGTKRPQPVLFQEPFVSQTDDNGLALNVIGSNGELYQFVMQNEQLPSQPVIKKIDRNVLYHWFCCCSGSLYLITNNKVRF